MKNKDEKKWDDIPEGYEEYTDDDFIDDLFDEQDDDEDIPADQRLTKEEFKELYNEASKRMENYYTKMAKEARKEGLTPEAQAFWNLIDSDEISEEDKQKLKAKRFGYM